MSGEWKKQAMSDELFRYTEEDRARLRAAFDEFGKAAMNLLKAGLEELKRRDQPWLKETREGPPERSQPFQS
jgi:hypothetical protein